MSKKSLIVGINAYSNYSGLKNAENDASVIGKLFDSNSPSRPGLSSGANYNPTILLNSKVTVTRKLLVEEINTLFQSHQDHLLFYFAGHATRSELLKDNFLVTSDGDDANPGVPMNLIIRSAQDAIRQHGVKSCTIILDCCHAGAMNGADFRDTFARLDKGITVLSACDGDQLARDEGGREGHGAFTSLLIDGLEGQASDILGRITPASLYALVDARMGGAAQRPMFKTHVNELIVLRKCKPKIALENIDCLTQVFQTPDSSFGLSPIYEKDRDKNFEKCFGKNAFPFDKDKHVTFRKLQECFRNGLIDVPTPDVKPEQWDCMSYDEETKQSDPWPPKYSGAFSMWHAAIYSAEVKLNHVGQYYWNLAKDRRLEEG